MSSRHHFASVKPLDLSKWRNVPNWLIVGGGGLTLLGLLIGGIEQFSYSWLLGFMFCLSLALGGLFLVLVHHLFDAGWSVPIRRINEHLAGLLVPSLAILFIPIALFSSWIYRWMSADPHTDHALHAKLPLFTTPMFYLTAVIIFAVWWLLASKLRFYSFKQDESGAASCTYAMRKWAAGGILLFALSLTLASIMWVMALQHQWFSTMYGVYYFAGSVWLTLATVYVITVLLERTGHLRGVLQEHQYYFLGSLLLAFTVFYAYISFSQYFIIWNANMPEETFWYKLREQGGWWNVGMIMIFGHFFLPFLALLRIDAKHLFPLMAGLCVWAWLMHFLDLSFNIMPVLHPDAFPWQWLWLDLACLALMVGILSKVWLKNFLAHPPYPQRDPRMIEAVGHYHPVSPISGGELADSDSIDEKKERTHDAHPQPNGGK